MSVEKIQLLHEDYIRLTERFKALWTFHQFVRGVYKTFFSADPGYTLDFTTLKTSSGKANPRRSSRHPLDKNDTGQLEMS